MSSAWDISYEVRAPRTVFVNFPLGHQTGKVDDAALQRRILHDALRAFETFWAPGQMLSLPYVWDPKDREWEAKDYGPNADLYGVGKPVPTQEEFGPERQLSRARG